MVDDRRTGAALSPQETSACHFRATLHEVERALDSHLLAGSDGDRILQRACDDLAGALGYVVVWIALKQNDGSLRFPARAGVGAPALRDYPIRWDDSPAGAGPNGRAIRTGQTQHITVDDDRAQPWSHAARRAGIFELAAMPITNQGTVLGALCVGAGQGGAFDAERITALELFAARLGLSLRLAEHQALLALQGAAMSASPSALFITDPAGIIQWVNAAFERMSGYGRDEAVGRSPAILRSDLQNPETFQCMWATVRAGSVWRGEIVNRHKNGEPYVVAQTVMPICDSSGLVTHLVAAHEDLTARRKAETMVDHLAHYDGVTDLPNRALFTERLHVAMVQADHSARPAVLLLIDLDRFKQVNDSFGHRAGDGVLRQIAERLGVCVRDGDLLARFGGDEFTILLPAADAALAAQIAERVLGTLTQPLRVAGQDIGVTASIGIAFSSPDATSGDTLVRRAEAAVSRARHIGRNAYAFYEPSLDGDRLPALSIREGLRRALARGELTLCFQPQVDTQTGALAGVEALLRWHSPELGAVAPGAFIPLAEETGIITEIDRWVIDAACAQARAWRDAGVTVPRVAVNVSGLSVRRGQLVATIQAALRRTEIPPACLEIELTEGIVMHDVTKVIETLDSLRRLGVRIALDDFGTGYSSLSYLKRFKLDVLKIDRSFIAGLPGDQEGAAIAQLIVTMATALRLETVAEGVETREQAALLRRLGCRTAQGFLYGPAVPAEEIARFAGERAERPVPFFAATSNASNA